MDALIERILGEARTVAVVGISDKPDRPSHAVARYLKERGYRIIPVNPALKEVLGEKAYPLLSVVAGSFNILEELRESAQFPPIAEEAVRSGARFCWMQEGVVNEEARERLAGAGIPVVMDRCVKKELEKRGR